MVGLLSAISLGLAPAHYAMAAFLPRPNLHYYVPTAPGCYLMLERQYYTEAEKRKEYSQYGPVLSSRPEIWARCQRFQAEQIRPEIVRIDAAEAPLPQFVSEVLAEAPLADVAVELSGARPRSKPDLYSRALQALSDEVALRLQINRATIRVSAPETAAGPGGAAGEAGNAGG